MSQSQIDRPKNNSPLTEVWGDLKKKIPQIEMALPKEVKGHAERLIMRAFAYIKTVPDMQNCTPSSICAAVIRGCEVGLPVDGRLCYLIKYGSEAQLSISWVGLRSVAKRCGTISDAEAYVVRKADHFRMWRDDNGARYEHRPAAQGAGDIIGAFACIVANTGRKYLEWMDAEQLEHVRKTSSKAPNSPAWKNYADEMYRKVVLRRALKPFLDDPSLAIAFEIFDQEFVVEGQVVNRRVSRSSLNAPAQISDQREAFDGPHAEDASQVEPDKPHISPGETRKGKASAAREKGYKPEIAEDGTEIPEGAGVLFDAGNPDATTV